MEYQRRHVLTPIPFRNAHFVARFDTLIHDVEKTREKAKGKWYGERRSRRQIQEKLQMIDRSSVDLSRMVNTLNVCEHALGVILICDILTFAAQVSSFYGRIQYYPKSCRRRPS